MNIASPKLRTCLRRTAVLAAACLLVSACHKAPEAGPDAATAGKTKADADDKSAVDAKGEPNAKQEAGEGVVLTPEQVDKLGLATQAATAMDFKQEIVGYGVVVAHDTIAQAVAELVTAEATVRLSQSALSRAKRLSGTPGAVSADVEETALHQAAVDEAALTLTEQKLSSTLGQKPPWKSGDNATLRELAGGRIKLLRVTFPLGSVNGATPASLRAAHIGAAAADSGWKMTSVWDAPADANVPGRSFFALLKGSDAGEGERLMAWAPVGAATTGVVIPAAAAVMSEGKYWCYVERKPGTYVRTEIDSSRPTAGGYFVTEGVGAGDPVVTTAAGLLLARESNSGSEPE